MTHQNFSETQSFCPWRNGTDPRLFLIIRLHAVGDVAVTLPACHGLRDRYPDAQIDYLTLEHTAPFLRSVRLFDHVFTAAAHTRRAGWLADAVRLGIFARRQRYHVILDLQRNRATRLIRRLAASAAWGEFDRFAPRAASDRVFQTFVNAGITISPTHVRKVHQSLRDEAGALLRSNGYDERGILIVLNPAGLWKTRNWPLEYFVSLARLWLEVEPVQFALIGTDRIREKAAFLKAQIGSPVIDLVGKTKLETAFATLQFAACVITEDSGLMHLAWCSGVPVLALFGSSRYLWSAPTGPEVRVLHSGDLPCGQCMEAFCGFGDVHCLTRYTPEQVLTLARELTLAARERIRFL